MEIDDLQKLAQHTRFMREASITLFIASGILAILFLISLPFEQTPNGTIAVATSTAPNAFANVPLHARAAIVYDLTTGETLYAKNADAQLPLASLTKLLTVYAAIQQLSPDRLITISDDATRVESPRVFSLGQTFSLADLARLTITASLNDGATAIASATAESERRTQYETLSSAAAALGLSQTYAVNGSGLDVTATVSGGYGSARDLARLAGALVQQAPSIAEATTKNVAKAYSTNGSSITVKNTDPMISSIPHLLLSKTGYTDLAGGNLALVFDSGIRHPIAVVVLGSSPKDRFTDGTALIAATFAHFAGVASL